MKEVHGIRVNQLAVTQIVAEPAAEVNSLEGTVAYLDSRSGENIAYSKVNAVWSPRTYSILADLIESMENDVKGHVTSSAATDEVEQDGTGKLPGLFPGKK